MTEDGDVRVDGSFYRLYFVRDSLTLQNMDREFLKGYKGVLNLASPCVDISTDALLHPASFLPVCWGVGGGA